MTERKVKLLESASGTCYSNTVRDTHPQASSAIENEILQLVDLMVDAFPEDGGFKDPYADPSGYADKFARPD